MNSASISHEKTSPFHLERPRTRKLAPTEVGFGRLSGWRGRARYDNRLPAVSSIDDSTGRVVQPSLVRALSLEIQDCWPRSPTTEWMEPSKQRHQADQQVRGGSRGDFAGGIAEALS